MKQRYHTLRLVLGDQLDIKHSWFDTPGHNVLYVIAELRQETDYVRHHIQKVCCFFLAMARFADALREAGHHVLHLTLDDTADHTDLPTLIEHLLARFDAERFEYQRPDEYRLDRQLAGYAQHCAVDARATDSEHFYLARDEIGDYFSRDQHALMETFYRKMRRRHDILMEGNKPAGGKWNFDTENRKKLPKDVDVPEPRYYHHDVDEILDRLDRHDVATIGRRPEGGLSWPVTRRESLNLVNHFCDVLLPAFGKYQDAMTDRGWSLFHSRLSFSLNAKLIRPDEVIERALAAWQARPDDIPLAAIEGFVRQIIGWREFMRGVYWTHMPGYKRLNTFGHDGTLPAFYWTGATDMYCLKTAIDHSLDHAYSHHIQRLMVTGNFALLAGAHPDAVDDWYLGIYADALQWVEITNTRGMSQFADGGIIATKPYISSGKYIQRMSDHCAKCAYNVGRRSGRGACPFNVFFWAFLDRHREFLGSNPRMGMMMRNLERIPTAELEAIRETAQHYRASLDEL
ncbi:MAG: cryptochrome/photolyase family protein [Gammaproteobacteria bacterium]|nr:cryptochrome/photolyase family protein [Gammaproteobacteria bacterium]